MKIATFKTKTPFGELSVLAVMVTKDDKAFAELQNAIERDDADSFKSQTEELIESVCEEIEVPEDILLDYSIACTSYEDCYVLCAIDNLIPGPFDQIVTDALFAFLACQEDIWEEYEDVKADGFENNLPKEAYVLPKLTDLYRIPRCSGQVFTKPNGKYTLVTDSIMDDFLDKDREFYESNSALLIKNTADLYECLDR